MMSPVLPGCLRIAVASSLTFHVAEVPVSCMLWKCGSDPWTTASAHRTTRIVWWLVSPKVKGYKYEGRGPPVGIPHSPPDEVDNLANSIQSITMSSHDQVVPGSDSTPGGGAGHGHSGDQTVPNVPSGGAAHAGDQTVPGAPTGGPTGDQSVPSSDPGHGHNI
ncbi:hypothetical protein C8Q77DRAFT_212709 [Trametes polyzona]|nr:hypothetical protein C8Q77DRAFT_212709 [Trametes polyzona]